MPSKFDPKTANLRKPKTPARKDKFEAADEAFESGQFGNEPGEESPAKATQGTKASKSGKGSYTKTLTYSAYTGDQKNRDLIMHRLYMSGNKINASEGVRLALHALAQYTDEQLVAAYNDWLGNQAD